MDTELQCKRDDDLSQMGIVLPRDAIDWHLLRLSVQTTIQERLGVLPAEIGNGSRGPSRVVFARHLSLHLLQTLAGTSLARTGALFGTSRQVTAYAMRKVEEQREDPIWDRTIDLMAAEAWRTYRCGRAKVDLGLLPRGAIWSCDAGEVQHG